SQTVAAPYQKQIGNVYASDQQDQADRRQQDQKRCTYIANQKFQFGHCCNTRMRVGIRKLLPECRADGFQICVRLLKRDAVLQTCDGSERMVSPLSCDCRIAWAIYVLLTRERKP